MKRKKEKRSGMLYMADRMNSAAYSGTALAFRDRLVIAWNKTQQNQTFVDPKRVYCKRKKS